jgi:integrase
MLHPERSSTYNNFSMAGTIRTLEKCPKCKGKFQGEPLRCRKCKTVPRRLYLDLWWQGERYRIFTGRDSYPLDSWDRANRLLTAIRESIDNGTFDPRDFVRKEIKHLLFENYIETWLERRRQECEHQHLARSYFKDLRGAAKNYFIPYFTGKNLRDIRAGDILDFRNWLPKTLSLKTVRNLLGFLHKLFQDAYQLRDILHLPAFPQIKVKEPVTRWCDEEDQARVLSHIKDPVYQAFFLFLVHQGCRPNEARALRWEKIDFKNGIVTIDAAFDLNTFRPSTKEGDTRYLPLHPAVKEALLQLPRHLNGFVFVNRLGRPLSGCRVYDHWRQAAAKAGVNVTCYEGTRHSLASQAINRGVSERIVGDMLGHKTSASTRRYAKMRADSLKQMWETPETAQSKKAAVSGPSAPGKVIKISSRKSKKK